MKLITVLPFLLVFQIVFAQLATEPSAQPTNLRLEGNDLAYRFDIKFDATTASGYLILRSKQPITATPTDGTAYEKGQGFGNAKVVSTSISTYLRINDVVAGTDYFFAIYAYNKTGSNNASINYLTTNPLIATITSKAADKGGYYSGIDFSSSSFIGNLTSLINTHAIVSYDQFDETVVAEFYQRDTIGAQKVINCQYSNETKLYSTFAYTALNYTREHRLPFSWVNFSGVLRGDFELLPEGCDLHGLELVQGTVNSERSSYPLSSNLVSTSYSYIDFRKGRDSRNKDVAEVQENRRGDVARAMFYMMVAYNGKYGKNWGITNLLGDAPNQQVSELIAWHNQDPPDAFELARHEYVYAQQGNRNPFIDYPDLVDCIDFTNLSLKTSCGFVGTESIALNPTAYIYPQPAADVLYLSIDGLKSTEVADITIVNIAGQLIKTSQITGNAIQLNVSDLNSGVYFYSINTGNHLITGRFLVAK